MSRSFPWKNILQFFEFSKIKSFFLAVYKSHKHGFKVIISDRSSYKTFSFINKNDLLILVENCFTMF